MDETRTLAEGCATACHHSVPLPGRRSRPTSRYSTVASCVALMMLLGMPVSLAQNLPDPIAPRHLDQPEAAQRHANSPKAPAESHGGLANDDRLAKLFGSVDQVDELPDERKFRAISPAADAVFSAEAVGRKTKDIGDLLRQSKSAHGIAIQNRTPIISDTRVRGQRVGQVLASGSYWAPARMDLDTMMSKIDSRLIEDLIVIKGPYATRYGPGFRFVDLEFIQSPRYENGYETHGSTGATFQSNGDQWYGRQQVWGGDEDKGFFISYGHRTGNDFQTGDDGFALPTSYKSRDLFAAFGFDINSHESVEINLLRLDQTDVEFPGLVFDLNYLVTDGYEVTYENDNAWFSDQFTAEFWYNRTRFGGDTLRSGKNRQIPTLTQALESASGVDGFGITDGDALSAGYRLESTYLTANGHYSFGTDLIFLNQELNDIEPAAPAADNNFPIPRSHSADIGFYMEDVEKVTPTLTLTAGARIDGVFTDSRSNVEGVPAAYEDIKDASLDQQFLLGAAYLTAIKEVSPGWTIDIGLGTSHRQPTLTEMYVDNSFIGSLQRGLTFLDGDPELDPEKIYQIDLGTKYRTDSLTCGLHGYHAWVEDYITYDLVDPAGTVDGFQEGAAFVNTDLATLAGFEAYGQYEVSDMLTSFATMSYTEGRDHTRQSPSRLSGFDERSAEPDVEKEALPGLPPLETRLGLLVQDPSLARRWGIEFQARIVDNQDRVARTLQEIETPGFTTYDIRTYRRYRNWLFTGGVENFTDKFYREHIDYRSGLGVFRPGINFYIGAEATY